MDLDISLLERLGGWVAVLAMVRWMMARQDRMLDNQDKAVTALQSSIDTFRAFQATEEDVHERLERTQAEILDEVRSLKPTLHS